MDRRSTAGGAGRQTRATGAPAFAGRAARAALRLGGRIAERWAPESAAARPLGPLRALAFADRAAAMHLGYARGFGRSAPFGPGVSAGVATGAPVRRAGVFSAPSWLFPVPWYQDELDWLAASRTEADHTARARVGARAPLPLAYVAPRLSDPGRSRARAPRPRSPLPRLVRVYSPLVPFAAAQAAAAAPPPALHRLAGGAPELAPVVPMPAPRAQQRGDSMGGESPSPGAQPVAPGTVPGAQPGQGAARKPAWRAPATAAPGAPGRTAAPAQAGADEPRAGASARGAGRGEAAPVLGSRVVLPAGLGGLAVVAGRASAEPLAGTLSSPGLDRAARARPPALAHMAWADRWLARMAGASRPTLRALEVATELSPAQEAERRGGSAPARVFLAGADDRGRSSDGRGQQRSGSAASRAPADRRPPPPANAGVGAGPAQQPPPQSAPVFDDDESVPEDVFAAIARPPAAARTRGADGGARAPEREGGSGVSAPSRPGRQLDQLLAAPLPPPGPGLRASLEASPLAALIGDGDRVAALGNPFDVRALYPEGTARAYAARLAGASLPVVVPDVGERALARERASSGTSTALPVAAAVPPAGAAPSSRSLTAAVGAGRVRSAPALRISAADPRPGTVARAAEQFASFQQLSAADLSYDFISPELVLAARAYGLGPAEAVRATRMATSGAGGLRAIAAAVELTVVEAIAGRASTEAAVGGARPAGFPERGGAAAPSALAWPAAGRSPRGAFLWPAAAARALGLRAADVERALPNVRTALDLVAAAEVVSSAARAGRAARSHAETASAPAPDRPERSWKGLEAVFLALSGPGGEALPPLVRAAGALARAPAGGGPASARVRAARAWAMMPVVLSGGAADAAADPARPARRPGHQAGRGAAPRRAGPGDWGALIAEPAADAGSPRPAPTGAVRRVPTAAPELVRTGSPRGPAVAPAAPASRSASPTAPAPQGAETKLPDWFEAAARKILDAGTGDELSVAEMTLVTAAPSRQVAASPRTPTRNEPAAPPPAGGARAPAAPDVEELAREVYGELCRMIEVARERGGDPWLP